MGVAELDAGLDRRENLWSLRNAPWKIHGNFDDMTKEERRGANSKDNVLLKLLKKASITDTFRNTVYESEGEADKLDGE